MKKLFLLLTFLIFILSINCQNYIDYNKGNFPIIITSCHGGSIQKGLKKRDCKKSNCSKDLYTKEITYYIHNELKRLNINSHSVVNNLHRKVLDTNREFKLSSKSNIGKKNYYEFHNKIQSSILNHVFSDSVILIIDIHGHTHRHGYIELGYDISIKELNKNLNNYKNSSLQNVTTKSKDIKFLGDMYKEYNYNAVPNSFIKLPKQYFNGGYITETYKSYPNTVIVQIEIPSSIRKNKNKRKQFSKQTAIIIKDYYNFLTYLRKK